MDIDLLRKRLKEIQESIATGTMPTVPGMDNTYKPMDQNQADTYNPPEVDIPDVRTPTTPANIPAPATNTTSSKPKVDPKTGTNGAKTFDDITTKSPLFAEEGIANSGLIDAYNAGLEGEDMSRETRDNAAAGGYLEQLEAMYNAGKLDAKPEPAPEANVPDAQTPTKMPTSIPAAKPISTNTQTPTTTPVSVPKPSATVSTPKIDPKTGANGAKVFADITAKRPMLGENSINDLIDAYNAGYNGTDINEEIKENAHAGDYTSEIEAVINAGLQDAKDSVEAAAKAPSVENSKAAIPSVNIPGNNVPKDLDNLENLSYTPSTTLGDIGTDKNADDSKSSNWSKYGTRNWDQDYNYIEDMMFLNGAESSSDPEVQKAYQYLANYENRDKKIPDEIMETFKTFMENVSSGKNNADMKIQMALQYVKDPKNQGKISPDTVKAVMNKTPDLDIQTLRDDQIKRSQGIALGDADVNYFDYNDLKNRNDFNPFHSPTDHYPNIKQSFGEYYSKKGGKHLADDIGYAGQKDPPVYSIYDGEVVVAQDNGNADGKGGNGLTVIIRHVINGKVFYSGYMHLKNYSVKVGDPVYGGEQIGIMGKTGGWINDDGKNGMDVHLHLTVFTCDDEDKFSHSPLGYSSNGKSYKGANNGVLYTFYDPQELIDTRGKSLWD